MFVIFTVCYDGSESFGKLQVTSCFMVWDAFRRVRMLEERPVKGGKVSPCGWNHRVTQEQITDPPTEGTQSPSCRNWQIFYNV